MKYKRRRSLVRIFVSLVPEILWKYLLPRPQRIYFNQNVKFMLGNVKCSVCQVSNFDSFRSYLSSTNKSSGMNLNSTPKVEQKNDDLRISDIQKELENLKGQIANILRQQQEKLEFSDYSSLNSLTNDSKSPSEEQQPAVPTALSYHLEEAAPPPPPPPPLPPYLITAKPSTVIKLKQEKPKGSAPPIKGFPCGQELLRDLKKVQLKKIQKSPGGGPLKKNKEANQDPGNFLQEVLKKRFSHIQNVSSDTSSDTTVYSSDSFTSDVSCKNSHDIKSSLIGP